MIETAGFTFHAIAVKEQKEISVKLSQKQTVIIGRANFLFFKCK